MTQYIASVPDGAIVEFAGSGYQYMKVCDSNGLGGVVQLINGKYLNYADLVAYGLTLEATVIADNLDEFYYSED